MKNDMYRTFGIGIAANQIGVNLSIAIITNSKMKNDPDYEEILIINPEIIEGGGKSSMVEGCLSFPNVRGSVVRREWVKLKYFDKDGNEQIIEHDGMIAKVIQHECLPHNAKIITKGGIKSIKWIVDNRYDGEVLSFSDDGTRQFKKIIGWSVKNNKDKKWVILKTSETGTYKQLICTSDHKCAVIYDIFNPTINYISASNMSNKLIITNVDVNRLKNKRYGLYNNIQMFAIFGMLLGDASISSKGEFAVSHGVKQVGYAQHIHDLLGGIIKPGYSGFKNNMSNSKVITPVTMQTKILRNMLYCTGVKRIISIIPYLNAISLAYWYMDDGCLRTLKRGKSYAQFHTEGFVYEDIIELQKYFTSLNMSSSIYERKINGKIRNYIKLSVAASEILFNMISCYIPYDMRYKLPEQWHTTPIVKLNNKNLDFSCEFIDEVVESNIESKLYDIEVDENHNVFANDTLVHNCDHLNGLTIYDRMNHVDKAKNKKIIRHLIDNFEI